MILVLVAIASPVLWHYSNGAEWLDALSMTREDIHVVVDRPTKPAIVKDFVLRNESVPLGEGFPGYSDAALAAMICRGEYRSIFETLPPANETPQPAPPTATPLPTGIVQDGDGTPTLPATRTPFATRIPASIPTARQIPPAAESATVISTPSESVAPRIRFDSSFETVYYLVSGTTTSAIFDSVESQGPDYEQETAGQFTAGLTENNSSYEVQFLDYGRSCGLRSAVVSLRIVVTLPQHSNTSSLSDLQRQRWLEFTKGVEVHEQTHVDIHIRRTEAFKKRMEGLSQRFSDCETLESSLRAVWDLEAALNDEQQEAFHEAEEQISRRLRDPVQLQIDGNKIRLTEFEASLDQISSEIDALKPESTEGERRVSILKWPEGALLNLG